jgi:hypothetical protein
MTSSMSYVPLAMFRRQLTLPPIACLLLPLVTFQRLQPLAMGVCLSMLLATSRRLLVPLATSVCLLMLPAKIRHQLTLPPTIRRLLRPFAMPHPSPAQPAHPPPCWNSTQHPH